MKGIKRELKAAKANVLKEIDDIPDGFFSRGLASEGYAGGYLQAIMDMELALNGINPNSRYWNKRK